MADSTNDQTPSSTLTPGGPTGPLILGDVAINSVSPGVDNMSTPEKSTAGMVILTTPGAAATPTADFAARFARLAKRFLRSTARVRRRRAEVEGCPELPGNGHRLRAESRYSVALERHEDLEDRLARLIRRLTEGKRRDWPHLLARPLDEDGGFAVVEWGRLCFSVDAEHGQWVSVRPASLLVRIDGERPAAAYP